ncbi:MAG: polyprenyl synthetase family protein [Candidatus Omnitrophota bacterium]
MANNLRFAGRDFLSEIFSPVKKELFLWERIYKEVLGRKEKGFLPLYSYLISLPQREIRPGLVFLTAKAVCRNELDPRTRARLGKFAVSAEIFHTALLLKNSVMQELNNDKKDNLVDKRESYAFLFSEYLFSRALRFLTEMKLPEVMSRLISIYNSITEDKIKGDDSEDIFNEDEYMERIKNKTAYLMSTICWAGVYLSERENLLIKAVENFGLDFGLSLQIVDDCLNVMEKGETIIRDLENKRISYSTVYPLCFLSGEEKREIANFLKGVKIKLSRAKIIALIYRAVELALKKAKFFSDRAKRDIDCLLESEFKESLIALADFPLERLAK